MPYNVGLSIRCGLREVERTIVRVDADNRNKAIMAAEEKVDRDLDPDFWSKAVAVTEACSRDVLIAA